jgi:rhodanese-related sulfurtransferase
MFRWFLVLIALSLTLGYTAPAMAYTDLTPQEAYNFLWENPESILLDVRTISEWNDPGHPGPDADDPSYGAFLNSRVFHIPWQEPRGTDNDKFDLAVTELFDSDDIIIAFCRSGSRSVSSCLRLEELGFTGTYNILYGFEGKTTSDGTFHKGWRDENLPWNKNGAGVWPAALAAAPLPASLPLLATGLGLLAWVGIRRNRF